MSRIAKPERESKLLNKINELKALIHFTFAVDFMDTKNLVYRFLEVFIRTMVPLKRL